MTTERGLFIVVEGLDKAGKSTQSARLVENVKKLGRKVEHMRFPDRTTPIGTMIDNYLRGSSEVDDHAIHLLFSANRWEAVPKITAAIEAGTTVIVDRYYWSGVVYTMAKRADNLSLDWARNCDVGLPSPDICFFLDISPEAARERGGGYGEERYEKEQFQAAVRQGFNDIFHHEKSDRLVRLDAGGPVDHVEQAMLQKLKLVFDQLREGKLRQLERVSQLS